GRRAPRARAAARLAGARGRAARAPVRAARPRPAGSAVSAPLSAAPPAAPAAPPPAQPWLAGRGAEVASLALFSAGGTWLTEALPFLPPHQAVLAVGATLLGAAGIGVERGAARRPTWPG